jgi:hypothetical protein
MWVILAALAAVGAAAAPAPQQAATNWVALVDGGHYGQSWSAAGALFRQQIDQAKWAETVAKARAPFGALQARVFASAEAKSSLPGAPDGAYEIITFNTRFVHKQAAVETVVLAREGASWKVDGYFIR